MKHSVMGVSISLLKPFQGVHCPHESHGSLTGGVGSTSRTKLAHVWPRAMCLRICNGMSTLLRECRKANLLHVSDMFPIVVGGFRPRGGPSKSQPQGLKTMLELYAVAPFASLEGIKFTLLTPEIVSHPFSVVGVMERRLIGIAWRVLGNARPMTRSIF